MAKAAQNGGESNLGISESGVSKRNQTRKSTAKAWRRICRQAHNGRHAAASVMRIIAA